jgi:hypothetical protein
MYSFPAPSPGIYYFQDDVYFRSMNGILVVNPASRPNFCPVGYVPFELRAQGTSYDATVIRVPYQHTGDSTTVILLNNLDNGRPHNFVLYSDPEGKIPIYRGNSIIGPGKTMYSFPTPRPGTYYYRDDITPGFQIGELTSFEVPTCGV